jgi:CotH kinase protein
MRRLLSSFRRLRSATAVVGLGLLLTAIGPATALAADEVAWMFDPDAVVEINLGGLSEEELDALEAEPDEYQKGTFELKVNGVTKGVPLVDVGIRRKGGFGSSRPIKTGKSGLKLRFDEFVDDQLFFGIKRLTLNNMFQDESMVHETLTYELFHALELPASRTGYAFVNLNGAKYGLFLNIETLDEISLPQWFPTTGHLFEADASGVDVRPGWAEKFEVDEGDDEDLSDLEALIAAANDEEGDWSDGMTTVADLERMTAEWAVERYVGHWDGYAGAPEGTPDPEDPVRPNNYYLHSDEAGIFQLMPWGTDQTWEFNRGFEASAGGLMFNKCLADASCRDLYIDGLTDIHCVNQELDQAAHATQLAAMLDPYQDEEDEIRRGYTAAEIAAEVLTTEDFAVDRAKELEEHLTDEGWLGGSEDPCAEPEEPEEPEEPGPAGGSPGRGGGSDTPPEPQLSLSLEPRVESAKLVAGRRVVTHLWVPGPGHVKKVVTARIGKRRKRVCLASERAHVMGPVKLHCRLSRAARERLAQGPLPLKVVVSFKADGTSGRWIHRRPAANGR